MTHSVTTMTATLMNRQQQEVVEHRGAPLLVLAAAGTGKTQALTSRIADIISRDGVDPGSILAVTFTNKAAAEMRHRAAKLSGVSEAQLCIGTFHSACARLLRQYSALAGVQRNFTIYDTNDSVAVLKRCMEELRLKPARSKNDEYTPLGFLSQIDTWRNDGLEPEAVPADEIRTSASKSFALRLYRMYRAKCKSCNAVDFSDLIMHVVGMLKKHPEVQRECQDRWRHVLVDEFQDTNKVQMQLIELLLREDTGFMVVGDDCQAIHEWRGAYIHNILQFKEKFPTARVVMLQTNYRSLPPILDLANEVIEKNIMRHEKQLIPHKSCPDGASKKDVVELHELHNSDVEAVYVAARIREMIDAGGFEPADFAVLYRTNAMSQPLEMSLAAANVPFHVRGACPFFSRAEVKDVLAYMRLALNPHSDVDFKRVLNTPPRGIGPATANKLEEGARTMGISMYSYARTAEGSAKRARQFAGLIDTLAHAIDDTTAPVRTVCALTRITDNLPEERAENISALAHSIDNFPGSLQEYLHFAAMEEQQGAGAKDSVALMTLHASKGLEFRVVFIVGAAEGMLPFYKSSEGAQLEEERRLCYVGVTRAKERLVITYPKRRILRFGEVPCVRSRFFIGLNSLRDCCFTHGEK